MHMQMDGMCGLPYLALLGVKKMYRGMGIGKKFLAMFIGVAEEYGAPNMFIMTSTFNVRAKQLYESVGFRKVGVLPSFSVKGVDEILFIRPNSKQK
jgi:ribosomal protein S18 acetylase RimI-like enzyme